GPPAGEERLGEDAGDGDRRAVVALALGGERGEPAARARHRDPRAHRFAAQLLGAGPAPADEGAARDESEDAEPVREQEPAVEPGLGQGDVERGPPARGERREPSLAGPARVEREAAAARGCE